MQPVQNPEIPEFVKNLQRFDTYDEIEEIMKSPDFIMAGAPERRIFLEDTLIMAEGQRHTELKQLFAPLMSRQAIAYYELNVVNPVVQDVISGLLAKRDSEGVAHADIVPLLHAALARISALVTGVDDVDTIERTDRFCDLVLELSAATTASYSSPNPDAMIETGRQALSTLVSEYLQPSLDRRIELTEQFASNRITKEDIPRDMLMSLCMAHDFSRSDDQDKIPYVWRQCALFLTASIKTTSHSMPHVFVHIDEWIKENPDKKNRLTDPDFLHRATAEAFRLHQTTPARFRAAVEDVTLSNGRKVAKGEMVALHAPIANTDPEVFGRNAKYFDPYRELPQGMQPWGMTFGLGRHSCLGRNFVTGIQNRGDKKLGVHGTAVCVLKALYQIGAELDPEHPPQRPEGSMHDMYESVPIILRSM